MKIKTLFAGSLAAVALAIGITTVVLINLKQPDQSQATQQAAKKTSDELNFTAEAGKNVLEQTKAHATVETKDSQYGPFVETINGKKEAGKYWALYVNDQMAAVGAAEFITNGGEKITWKLE